MSVKKVYEIVDGPNREELFDACKNVFDEASSVTSFSIVVGFSAPRDRKSAARAMLRVIEKVKIIGIEHEDGSGENFNLRGYCEARLHDAIGRTCKFKAYYNSKKKEGRITLE